MGGVELARTIVIECCWVVFHTLFGLSLTDFSESPLSGKNLRERARVL